MSHFIVAMTNQVERIKCVSCNNEQKPLYSLMPRTRRNYKLSTISFVTFGVSKLLLGNPPHTEANSFKSCKAENANIQCNRIAHALHTKDVSKLLCSAHCKEYFTHGQKT